MAVLKDNAFDETGISFELSFGPSEFYGEITKWVTSNLTLNFGGQVTPLKFSFDSEEIPGYIQEFEKWIDSLDRGDYSYIFDPMDPDYHLFIRQDNDYTELIHGHGSPADGFVYFFCRVDTRQSGVYYPDARGLHLGVYVSVKCLIEFLEKCINEVLIVERESKTLKLSKKNPKSYPEQ